MDVRELEVHENPCTFQNLKIYARLEEISAAQLHFKVVENANCVSFKKIVPKWKSNLRVHLLIKSKPNRSSILNFHLYKPFYRWLNVLAP